MNFFLCTHKHLQRQEYRENFNLYRLRHAHWYQQLFQTHERQNKNESTSLLTREVNAGIIEKATVAVTCSTYLCDWMLMRWIKWVSAITLFLLQCNRPGLVATFIFAYSTSVTCWFVRLGTFVFIFLCAQWHRWIHQLVQIDPLYLVVVSTLAAYCVHAHAHTVLTHPVFIRVFVCNIYKSIWPTESPEKAWLHDPTEAENGEIYENMKHLLLLLMQINTIFEHRVERSQIQPISISEIESYAQNYELEKPKSIDTCKQWKRVWAEIFQPNQHTNYG